MNEKQAAVINAEAAAKAARDRIGATLVNLQARLNRRSITRRARKRMSNVGVNIAQIAQAQPAASGGIAVIGLLLIRRWRRRGST